MNLQNFHYALTLAEMLYGTTVREDLGEEILLTGWNLIGNKRMQIYRYKVCIDECEKGVELPCNCDIIEAVTTNFEDWDYVTNDTPNGNIYTAFVENYIENRKAFRNPLYAKGKFINYESVGDLFYFYIPH